MHASTSTRRDGHRLLVMHQGALGDLLLSLPCLYTIRSSYPKHHCAMVGYPEILCLVHERFYADSIVSADTARIADLYREGSPPKKDTTEYLEGFQTAFVFGGQALECVAVRLREIIGPQVFRIAQFPRHARMHVTEFQVHQLAEFGYTGSEQRPQLFPSPEDMHEALTLLRGRGLDPAGTPLVAVHTGSGSTKKNWPVENFLYFMEKLCRARQCAFLVIRGPAEQSSPRFPAGIHMRMPTLVLDSLKLSLLAAVVKQCTTFIGNDSGITHLAAAVGIPTLAVFGPTDPAIWGPRGTAVTVLRNVRPGGAWEWIHPAEAVREALRWL